MPDRGVVKRFIATVEEGRYVEAIVINWVFEFTRPDGHFVRMDELARQRWAGDKIVEERFYYDPGHLLPAKPG